MPSIHKFLRLAVPVALFVAISGTTLEVEAASVYDTRETDRTAQRTVRMMPDGDWTERVPPPNPPPRIPPEFPWMPSLPAPTPTPPAREEEEEDLNTGIRLITPSFRTYIRDKKRQNSDVIGWLQVPGTNIDDVVLQNPSRNNPYAKKNEYYLNRNFAKQPDKNGVFSADHRASFDGELSRVTTLYGHSWDDNPDGDIFAQLKRYREPDFARENPYIFFSTEDEDMAWEVFAVFDTTIYLPYVRPSLSADVFYETLDMVYGLSYYNYDVAVDANDRILALSTCTFSVDGHPDLPAVNDYRFVVMARLVDPGETPRDSAVLVVNSSRLAPDVTRSMSHL